MKFVKPFLVVCHIKISYNSFSKLLKFNCCFNFGSLDGQSSFLQKILLNTHKEPRTTIHSLPQYVNERVSSNLLDGLDLLIYHTEFKLKYCPQYSNCLLLLMWYRSEATGFFDSNVHSGSFGSSDESPESDIRAAGESGSGICT